jgi:Smg protein
MNETVLDVLMFLFENYYGTEVHDAANQPTLREELTAAGFDDHEVSHAFRWLRALAEQRSHSDIGECSGAIRIYAPEEMDLFSTECRGFLHYLEQLGILTATSRELVIDRLLAMTDEVELDKVKSVCLVVLLGQPGEEEAAWALEDLLFCGGPLLH